MWIFYDIISLFDLIIYVIKTHFWYVALFVAIIWWLKYKRDFTNAKEFLRHKFGMIILDGKFWKGKNRFMVNLQSESSTNWYFTLSNFYSWHTFIRWNSLTDLKDLLHDVWTLWEYQNFSDDELKVMYSDEGKERVKEKFAERKAIRKKFKHIPNSWFFNKFLITCDEFQNLFFNRWAMGNFSGDNADFLKLLHQVRHFNTLMVFATQESWELDVKFRRLSSYYIRVFDYLDWIVYWYNVFEFVVDREQNMNLESAKRFTRVPVWMLNFYKFNVIINKIERRFKRKIKFRFSQLKFFSKFNADPDRNIYTKGDLLVKLNNYYKNEKDKYKHTNIE